MAYEGDTPKGSAIDRSDRHGHIGWVLLLAGILVGATLSLRFLGMRTGPAADPRASGLLRHGGRVLPLRHGDRRRAVLRADGAQRYHQAHGRHVGRRARGDRGRRAHHLCQRGLSRPSPACRAARCGRSSACSPARPKSRRRSIVSRRPRANIAPARRKSACRLASNGAQEFGWYRVRVRPVPRPNGRQAALWTIARSDP